jgi:hypothetical protein
MSKQSALREETAVDVYVMLRARGPAKAREQRRHGVLEVDTTLAQRSR